ncbi:MAG: MarR family transcriptional regulator [Micrococcales bacterium]|nr:MarR family transcriptional regulator [Micrococcales bacterium]
MRSDRPVFLPVFRSRHQAEVLTWLLLHPGTERNITDLADCLGVPLSTLQREVARLHAADLVTSRFRHHSRMVRAATDHPAANALTRLLKITFGPKIVVAEELDLPDVQRVVIFGSWAARYTGQVGPPPQEVDVLVVGSVDRATCYAAADRAQTRLGVTINPVLRTPQQWDHPDDDQLLVQIQASPFTVVLDRTLGYLERTDDLDDVTLTGERLAVIDRRNAERETDPSIGVPEDGLMARLRAW